MLMKILTLGDPHGKLPKNLDSIIKKNKPALIVCTGDYAKVKMLPDGTGLVNNQSQKKIIKKIGSFNLPVLTLKGNMYLSRKTKKIFTKEINKYKNIHYKHTGKLNIKDQNFIFFDFLYEKESLRVRNNVVFSKMRSNANREKKLNKLLKENKNPILIAHNPPYGVLDQIHSGKHVGSKILLKAIKKHQPKYVFCGHIHEGKGMRKIGKTEVHNLGICGYKVIEIQNP